MKIEEILETCIYVDDLEAAEHFYRNFLGLEMVSKLQDRHVFFQCGNQMFLIFNPEATDDETLDFPPHGAKGAGHVAFGVKESELDPWKELLIKKGVEIEHELTWPTGGRSIYFRDPAGNSLELVTAKTWEITEENNGAVE